MAKLEAALRGDFNDILRAIDQGVLKGSVSATLEDHSSFCSGPFRCAVRVFERYSYMGKNRVSMNITLVSDGQRVFLSAITAGGSQAMFFKLNTFGEEAFLDTLRGVVARYQ